MECWQQQTFAYKNRFCLEAFRQSFTTAERDIMPRKYENFQEGATQK